MIKFFKVKDTGVYCVKDESGNVLNLYGMIKDLVAANILFESEDTIKNFDKWLLIDRRDCEHQIEFSDKETLKEYVRNLYAE